VSGSYVSLSRALINIIANALDAIKAAVRPGRIEFVLEQEGDLVTLTIVDNGIGISAERLQKGPDRLPLFVGHSTKGNAAGEGVGTQQVYATFGADQIQVESQEGVFTRWIISLKRSTTRDKALHIDLYTRYVRFIKSTQKIPLNGSSSRTEISGFIWQLREMELFSYDLAYQFSRYNNIRDIFHNLLLYRFGGKSFDFLKEELGKCRIDNKSIRSWLLGMTRRISRNETYLREEVPFQDYKDVLFQSYGQDANRTMIFTLDPDNGAFFTTDRKLAEHLDFVPYLGRDRDALLRGELIGDVRRVESPVYLGVWSVKDRSDLNQKLTLIQQGAVQLLAMGLDPAKPIAFYNTTYSTCDWEIDTLKTISLGDMVQLRESDFERFVRPADSEMGGMLFSAE